MSTTHHEITERSLGPENYGEGPPPEGVFAVPEVNGPYLTAGKAYPVVEHRAWVYEIVCDLGHRRVVSMQTDTSAHLPETTERDKYGSRIKVCGTIRIFRSV